MLRNADPKEIDTLWIKHNTYSPKSILHIGCGSGKLLQDLKDIYGKYVLYNGIESPTWKNITREVLDDWKDKIIWENFNCGKYRDKYFDLVIDHWSSYIYDEYNKHNFNQFITLEYIEILQSCRRISKKSIISFISNDTKKLAESVFPKISKEHLWQDKWVLWR